MIWEEDEKSREDLIPELSEALIQRDNKVCADCGESDPKWSSINLGIVICIKCAGLHRSLGSHISKVKSLYLDKWTAEQAKNLSNSKAKRIYEAQLTAGGTNVSSFNQRDREEWIRSKYERLDFAPHHIKYAMRPFVTPSSLPDTLWLFILSHMEDREVGRMSQVSLRFKRLSEQQNLWRHFLERTWHIRFWNGPSQPVGHFPNYKQLYIRKKVLITSLLRDSSWKHKSRNNSTLIHDPTPTPTPEISPPSTPQGSPKSGNRTLTPSDPSTPERDKLHQNETSEVFDVEWNVLVYGQEFPQKGLLVESHGMVIRLNMVTYESQTNYTAVLFFFPVVGMNESGLQTFLKDSLADMKVTRISAYIPSLILGLRKPGNKESSISSEVAKRVASRNNVLMYVETSLSANEINDIAVLLAEMIIERLAKDPATNIPGFNTAPNWIPDECVNECMLCSAPFSVFVRRHHCRRCGGIFCAKCSDRKAALPALYNNSTAQLRVCDRCWQGWR